MSANHDVDDDIVCRANKLLTKFIHPYCKVSSVSEILTEHFALMYELATHEFIPGAGCMKDDHTRIAVCDFIINSLADDVLGIPLEHLSGVGVVNGNTREMSDLLEIFEDIFKTLEDADVPGGRSPSDQGLSASDLSIVYKRRLSLKASESKRKPLSTIIMKSKDCMTQTTPAPMASSQTSPIIWQDILRDSLRSSRKVPQKPTINKFAKSYPLKERYHCLNADITKLLEKENIRPTNKSQKVRKGSTANMKKQQNARITKPPSYTAMRDSLKVKKPKPVLGTKVRRKSSTGSCANEGRGHKMSLSDLTPSCTGVDKFTISLQRQFDDFRSFCDERRKDIKKKIKELKEEDGRLAKLQETLSELGYC